MLFLNQVHIEGRLTRNPELKKSKNGTPYIHFGICYNQLKKLEYKDNDGNQWESVPHFFNCVAFNKTAERIAEYKKGEPVSIFGKLQFSQFEKDGEKISNVNISVTQIKKLFTEKSEKPKTEEPKKYEDFPSPCDYKNTNRISTEDEMFPEDIPF